MKVTCSLTILIVLFLNSTAALHECDRKCIKGEKPKICHYELELEEYLVLSRACYHCPFNITDCWREDCISANGVQRVITVINRLLPGPPVVVCEGDLIVADVENHAGSKGTTIHWHGQNQIGTPHMDGVPMVTQCPISPFTTFRYTFTAADSGTYFYHAHIGFQRTDGVHGMFVVRVAEDPNASYYDYDLSDHLMMVTDWINKSGEPFFYEMYHGGDTYPAYLTTILVNGKGQLKPFQTNDGRTIFTPVSEFKVKRGYRYRFRVCSNGNYICPIHISVDNHNMTIIATDGDSIEPITVESFVINPGERFDFVLNTNQRIGNYWIRAQGLLLCSVARGGAILRYEGAPPGDPPGLLTTTTPRRNGTIVNPINAVDVGNVVNYPQNVTMVQLVSKSKRDPALKAVPDVRHYIPFDLYENFNPEFYRPGFYPATAFPPELEVKLPMINSTAFAFPTSPLLSQYRDIPKGQFCNRSRDCEVEFCRCTNIIKVKLNAVVELILVDIALAFDAITHPFHLHGHHFRVVGEGKCPSDVTTVEKLKLMDSRGLITRNLRNPIIKDTISVPRRGYTVLRFYANNPGFWLFHCHVELHSDGGMSLVFQVGELSQMKSNPSKFPRCANYIPSVNKPRSGDSYYHYLTGDDGENLGNDTIIFNDIYAG